MGETGKGLHRNAMSYVGGLVMGVGATLVALSLAMEFGLSHPSPYLGIFTYLLFPMVLAAGFGVFLWGMRRESMRRRRSGLREALPYPLVDLNLPAHRRKFAWVLVGGGLLVVLLAFVSYNAFLFTESVTFCGKICHTVMEPEFTAYQQSPHARVPCVDCHVGAGATWYVKSKLSGLRQVVAVTFGTYETPIPVPIKDCAPRGRRARNATGPRSSSARSWSRTRTSGTTSRTRPSR